MKRLASSSSAFRWYREFVAEEPKEVIAQVARQRRAPLIQLGEDFAVINYRDPANGSDWLGMMDIQFRSDGDEELAEDIPIGLVGEHQAANAAVAFATLRTIQKEYTVTTEQMRKGFAAARCEARIEVVGQQPWIVVDAAHNVASVEALVAAIESCFPCRRRHLLLATTRGKDVRGILHVLLPRFDTVTCTRYLNNPRAFDLNQLASLVRDISTENQLACGTAIATCDSPATAWQQTSAAADPGDLICVTGSFFIAAEVREIVVAS